MIPEGLQTITDYIVSNVLGERKLSTPRLPPPSLLVGARGTGKSWILSEVKNRIMEKCSETGIYPIEVPWTLSADVLIESIQQKIEQSKLKKTAKGLLANEKEDKFLLLIEEIDSYFKIQRVDSFVVRPKRSKGAGIAIYSQIRNASRLRSFLIERHESISVLATASEDLRFLQDPELPFFQFFNVININPLNQIQTLAQIKSKIPKEWRFGSLIESLNKISPGFYYKITDGKILYINSLSDAVADLQNGNVNLDRPADEIINLFLTHYFHRLDPYMHGVLETLSASERYVIDHATLLADEFKAINLKPLRVPDIVRTLYRLTDKGVLKKVKGSRAKYQFSSDAMKSYLRFRRKIPSSLIIAPHLPAI